MTYGTAVEQILYGDYLCLQTYMYDDAESTWSIKMFIQNMTGILKVTTFKYSLHKLREPYYTKNTDTIPSKFTVNAHYEHL